MENEQATGPQWIGKAHLTFDYFSCSSVAESFANELVALIGWRFNYRYENLDIFYDARDVDKHAALLVTDVSRIEREIQFIRQQIAALETASREFGPQPSVDALEHWYRAYRAFLPALGVVFGIEQALDKMLKSFLSADDFLKVAFAREMATAREQKSLFALAQLPEDSDEFNSGLKKHVQEFAWLGNKMMRLTPFTEAQVLERVTATRPMASEKLAELEAQRRALEVGAREVIARLSSDQAYLVTLYQEILALRTERADAVCQAAQLTSPLFSWIGEQLSMTREELLRFSYNEIRAMLLAGKREDPATRESYSLFFVDGQVEVRWGSWGKVDDRMNDVREFMGTVACRGMARGTVKIIQDSADLQKFERGNILVASYTNPNLLPAMEKAAAIVTNIGGMTSHAAIVSRELNVPCIIGTKIATQVLKDGDLVEVDAVQGVVRKI